MFCLIFKNKSSLSRSKSVNLALGDLKSIFLAAPGTEIVSLKVLYFPDDKTVADLQWPHLKDQYPSNYNK